MRKDWSIWCVDCSSEHGFNDANHQEELMHEIIGYREIIASMAPMMGNINGLRFGFLDRSGYGDVDAGWFAKHAGHHLVARSEYGDISEEKCACCGALGPTNPVTIPFPRGNPIMGLYCDTCIEKTVAPLKALLTPKE